VSAAWGSQTMAPLSSPPLGKILFIKYWFSLRHRWWQLQYPRDTERKRNIAIAQLFIYFKWSLRACSRVTQTTPPLTIFWMFLSSQPVTPLTWFHYAGHNQPASRKQSGVSYFLKHYWQSNPFLYENPFLNDNKKEDTQFGQSMSNTCCEYHNETLLCN
jgi:hypothetical protein